MSMPKSLKNSHLCSKIETLSVNKDFEACHCKICSKCSSGPIFVVDWVMSLSHQIFIGEKSTYYSFINKTKNMTGNEVFNIFTQKFDK